MTTFTELENDLTLYSKEHKTRKRGLQILNKFTKDLYLENSECYNRLAQDFYQYTVYNDSTLTTTFICHWLVCSDFKDDLVLQYLQNIGYPLDICKAYCESNLKYEVLTTWCNIQPAGTVISLFTVLSSNSYDSYPNALKPIHVLKLINNVFIKNPNLDNVQKHQLNSIISTLNLDLLPTGEVVKMMIFNNHLDHKNFAKLEKLYPKNKLVRLLRAAEALCVVDDPNYWVQSLSSMTQQNSFDLLEPLPEL